MPSKQLFLGLDLGTSGARAVVIDKAGREVACGKAAMADFSHNPRDPQTWWSAADAALRAAISDCDGRQIVALSVDGTSGTMVPVNPDGAPLAHGIMYNDPCQDTEILARISSLAPAESAAHGSSSALARAIVLRTQTAPHAILHQADWIAFQLSGVFASDENNALKTGYDPIAGAWPGWIADTGLPMNLLPKVFAPGDRVAPITRAAAASFDLSPDTVIVAGTTDGCASFLATGARRAGDGVSALGTTLTIKILSDKPIFAPESGIYSHKVLGKWLAGGASNTGGNVLLEHFSPEDIRNLSTRIEPNRDTGLDYYPLARPGERFPIADPDLPPQLDPRPADDAEFLQGLFEGIAAVEALGYTKLAELGAPPLTSVRSVGGGAQNRVWTAIRQRKLGVRFDPVASDEAAYGTALLARRGAGA